MASTTIATPRKRFAWKYLIGAVIGLTVLGYISLLTWIYLRQESLIFRPVPLAADYQFGLPGANEVSIDVGGAKLSALHLKLPNPKGVVFFLHGNSGNLVDWFTNPDFYRGVNYDLFMIDYRGYGKSTGAIESEVQLRSDVRKAWQWLAPQYKDKRMVIYGRSLGTGLAAGLAAETQPSLTILVSPYCSMTELARSYYPYIPEMVLRYPLATCADVPRIKSPLLLIHGKKDTLIPFENSVRLQKLAPKAELFPVPEAAHNDVHKFQSYYDLLARSLNAL